MKLVLSIVAALTFAATPCRAQNQSPLVDWISFQDAVDQAPAQNKKVLIDIFAPWCGWCSKMQKEAYMDETILNYLRANFITARLDISVQDDTLRYRGYELPSAHLAAGFGAEGTPTTVFLSADGEYITRLPGYAAPEEFLTVLKFIATDSYQSVSFAEFTKTQN